jgi:DnaJ-class molecular chaperone
MKKECLVCDGLGWVDAWISVDVECISSDCLECNGTGYVEDEDEREPNGKDH